MKSVFLGFFILFSSLSSFAELKNGVYECTVKDKDDVLNLHLELSSELFVVSLPQGSKHFVFSDERQESELPGTYLARRFQSAVLIEYEVTLDDSQLNMGVIILNETPDGFDFLWDIKILTKDNAIKLRDYPYRGFCDFQIKK